MSSNEESGYLALLENEIKRQLKAQRNFKMTYELSTEKQLEGRF